MHPIQFNSIPVKFAATLNAIVLTARMVLLPMRLAVPAAESDATQSSVPGQIQFSGALPVAGSSG